MTVRPRFWILVWRSSRALKTRSRRLRPLGRHRPGNGHGNFGLYVAGAGKRWHRGFSLRSVFLSVRCFTRWFTGILRFKGRGKAEIMAAILRDQPEPLPAAKFQAPAPLFWILERCLAKDPNQRYASTRDLARDLATVRDLRIDAGSRHKVPRPSNMPVPRTVFIGREREVADLRQLLSRKKCGWLH